MQSPDPSRHSLLEALIAVPTLWALEVAIGVLAVGVQAAFFGGELGELSAPEVLLLSGALSGAATILTVWFVCAHRARLPAREGLLLGRFPARAAALGVLIGLVGAALGTLVTIYLSTGESAMADLVKTRRGLLCVSVIAVAFAPLAEELYYRGLLFSSLRRALERGVVWLTGDQARGLQLGPWAALAAVTLWFGAIHIPQLWGDPLVIPVIFAMSLIWTTMRWRTGSLWPSLLSHLTYNTTLIVISWLTFEA
jgi:membrane protease YdiL (CAAX protease family)